MKPDLGWCMKSEIGSVTVYHKFLAIVSRRQLQRWAVCFLSASSSASVSLALWHRFIEHLFARCSTSLVWKWGSERTRASRSQYSLFKSLVSPSRGDADVSASDRVTSKRLLKTVRGINNQRQFLCEMFTVDVFREKTDLVSLGWELCADFPIENLTRMVSPTVLCNVL